MRKKQEYSFLRNTQVIIYLTLSDQTPDMGEGNYQHQKDHRKLISRVGGVLPRNIGSEHVAPVPLCNARGLSVSAPHNGEALAPPVAPTLA